MNLQRQKADTIKEHLERILGASDLIIRESTNKDIAGITIVTPKGSMDIGRSQYGGELEISVTVPEKEFTATLQAFGAEIVKGFKTEKERDDFIATLPEETQATSNKGERTI